MKNISSRLILTISRPKQRSPLSGRFCSLSKAPKSADALSHTALNSPGTSDPVSELYSFFSRLPYLRNDAYLNSLDVNLTAQVVEIVLKRLKKWKSAHAFFTWASEQDGFRHTCYTYNMMAEILSLAKQKNPLRLLVKDMVSSNISTSPGALGFLIRILGSQGLMEEANYVFDHAKFLNCVPNNYTYNCLLEVLAKGGRVDLVELRFREMIDSGRQVDKYTLTPVLQAYCNEGKFEEALSIFSKIRENYWMDEHVFTILVVSFCKWGEVDKAFELIHQTEILNIQLNEKTYYVLIHGFVKENRINEALTLFEKMTGLGFIRDMSLYSVLISGLCEIKEVKRALHLYDDMKRSGILPDASLIAKLISHFCTEVNLDMVNRLIEENEEVLNEDNAVIVYNAILEGLIRNDLADKAHLLLCSMMGSRGFKFAQLELPELSEQECSALNNRFLRFSEAKVPNDASFTVVIDSLCRAKKLDLALELANCMIEMGCVGNFLIYNNLIRELCESDRLEETYDVLRKMKELGIEPTQFTYNAILGYFCRRGNVSDALNLIKEMRYHGHEPWTKNYTMLVKQLCTQGKIEEAYDFLHKMVEVGFVPNIMAYSSVMDGWCKFGQIDQALQLFREIVIHHHLPDLVAHNVIICGLCKSGRVTEAENILREMSDKGLVPSVATYNLLIDGWCKIGRVDDALICYSKMTDAGRPPMVVTYTTLIDGLCNSKRPEEALDMWKQMKEKACDPNRITYLALVSGLCKCGWADEAYVYFSEMEREGHKPNTFVYMSLINVFIAKGKSLEAFKLLKEMVEKAKCPNPGDKQYPFLIDALSRLSEEKRTCLDGKKLVEEGCIPDILSLDNLMENTDKILDQ